jgi:hypothetical protein
MRFSCDPAPSVRLMTSTLQRYPQILGEPSAHRRVRFNIRQNVQERVEASTLVQPAVRVGPHLTVAFQQAQEISRCRFAEDLNDPSSGLGVGLFRHPVTLAPV